MMVGPREHPPGPTLRTLTLSDRLTRRDLCRRAAALAALPAAALAGCGGASTARRPSTPLAGAPDAPTTTHDAMTPSTSADALTIRRAHERGHANHGWLDANHTFSFAGYQDPQWVHFGPLRVINQDRVQPRQGFPTHGHEDMEIVTYVLDGVLEHKDSMGNGSQMSHGEVQLMSAGTGVTHSEFSASDDELHLLQMWVFPSEKGYTPRYEQKRFAPEERRGKLRLVVSPDGADGSLTIGSDAKLFAGEFTEGESQTFQLPEGRSAWIHVARGTVRINGERFDGGDGAGVAAGARLEFEGVDAGELVMWELVS